MVVIAFILSLKCVNLKTMAEVKNANVCVCVYTYLTLLIRSREIGVQDRK